MNVSVGARTQGYFPVIEFWNQLSTAILVNVGLQPPKRRSITAGQLDDKKSKPTMVISPDDCAMLSSGAYARKYGFRSLDSACLVLRIARQRDCRLQKNERVEDFFKQLEELEQYDFATKSFAGKTVVAVEGLKGSGKSTVMRNIGRHCPGLQTVSVATIPHLSAVRDILHSLPEPISQAFDYVVRYIVAHEIIKSEATTFFAEDYYHSLCATNVCDKVKTDEQFAALPSSVFEWPLDLPLPELVLFLCIPTEVRLQRSGVTGANDPDVSVRDARASMVYSMVRGPGTVGLDASLAPEDVAFTALEALEYYGVYAISRLYDPEYNATPTPPLQPQPAPTQQQQQVELGPVDPLDPQSLSPLTERSRGPSTAAQRSKHKRRTSICFKGRKLSGDLPPSAASKTASTEASENVDPQVAQQYQYVEYVPELPEEAIQSRRVSMGVYEMFTKL